MNLLSLSSQALFFISFFSILAGYFLFLLLTWKNKRRSKIFKVAAGIFSVFSMSIVSFLAFNSRNVQEMLASPKRLMNAGVRYCPDPTAKSINSPVEKKAGCELVYRAFELGLLKDLGTCAPDTRPESPAYCDLRQYDEPWLHYSARQFSRFLLSKKKQLDVPDLRQTITDTFEKQLEHTDALVGKLKHVVKSAPKASHHIFTNLPYPDSKFEYYWDKWFHPKECLHSYKNLPHTFKADPKDPRTESKVFEFVYGQMLFNPNYSLAAGSCLEYTIHWNTPENTCRALAENPEEFLKKQGLDGEIKTVLNRLEEQHGFQQMQYQIIFMPLLRAAKPVPPSSQDIEKIIPKVGAHLEAEQVVSFQCFIKRSGSGSEKALEFPFQFAGERFSAREIVFSGVDEADKVNSKLYKNFSQLLTKDFNYSGFLSNEGTSLSKLLSTAAVGPEQFNDGAFPLSRLEYLKTVDVFMDHPWLQGREDLLEIYPYYHHLYNFVNIFRKHYHLQRTRL